LYKHFTEGVGMVVRPQQRAVALVGFAKWSVDGD
jgi:hypothetical protein